MMRIVRRRAVILLGEDLRELTINAPLSKRLCSITLSDNDDILAQIQRHRNEIYIQVRIQAVFQYRIGHGSLDEQSERLRRFVQPFGRDQPDKQRSAFAETLLDRRDIVRVRSQGSPCVFVPFGNDFRSCRTEPFHLIFVYQHILYLSTGTTDIRVYFQFERGSPQVLPTGDDIITAFVYGIQLEFDSVDIELAHDKALIVVIGDIGDIARVVCQAHLDRIAGRDAPDHCGSSFRQIAVLVDHEFFISNCSR